MSPESPIFYHYHSRQWTYFRNKVSYDQLIIFGTCLISLWTLTGKCTNFVDIKLAVYFENHTNVSSWSDPYFWIHARLPGFHFEKPLICVIVWRNFDQEQSVLNVVKTKDGSSRWIKTIVHSIRNYNRKIKSIIQNNKNMWNILSWTMNNSTFP